MDTQEIPILTEVFKAKTVKTQPDVVEVTPEVRQMIANELRPLITQEVIQALKPVLEAEITEALSQQLFAALSTHINAETAQISAQLSTDITAHVSKDITNHLQQEVITPLQTTLNQSLTHIQEARETFEQSITGQLNEALTQHQSARDAFEQSATDKLNDELEQQQLARKTFEQSVTEKLNDALTQQQSARTSFEETLTQKLELDHARYTESLNAQSQQLLEAAQLALTNKAETLGDAEIMRVTSETEAKVTSIQEEAIAKIKTQIADSESASEDIFKYAVNAYSEQTQTRLFEEVATQQLKFTQALETFVTEAQANMQTTLFEQVREHMKTQMHQELTEQKQAAIDVMADFYQAKVTETTESANQLAQSLNKELVQTMSSYAHQLSEDTTQHLKQVQESLLAEATERIRLQVEQELRVTADGVRQDFNHALNADLPEIQQLLAAKVQELFTAELPNFEQIVLARAKAEVGQILSGIRLAFPS